MVAGYPVVGTKVVTTASLAQPLPDSSGHETAGKIVYFRRSLLAIEFMDVHGKEKIYGSIP